MALHTHVHRARVDRHATTLIQSISPMGALIRWRSHEEGADSLNLTQMQDFLCPFDCHGDIAPCEAAAAPFIILDGGTVDTTGLHWQLWAGDAQVSTCAHLVERGVRRQQVHIVGNPALQ